MNGRFDYHTGSDLKCRNHDKVNEELCNTVAKSHIISAHKLFVPLPDKNSSEKQDGRVRHAGIMRNE